MGRVRRSRTTVDGDNLPLNSLSLQIVSCHELPSRNVLFKVCKSRTSVHGDNLPLNSLSLQIVACHELPSRKVLFKVCKSRTSVHGDHSAEFDVYSLLYAM